MNTDQLLALIQAEQKKSEDLLAHWQQQLQQAQATIEQAQRLGEDATKQIIARQVDLQRLAWLVEKITGATPEAIDQTS